jgi:hypothetical protein
MNPVSKTPAKKTDAEIELPLAGFTGTPEEIERQWFETGLSRARRFDEAAHLARGAHGHVLGACYRSPIFTSA